MIRLDELVCEIIFWSQSVLRIHQNPEIEANEAVAWKVRIKLISATNRFRQFDDDLDLKLSINTKMTQNNYNSFIYIASVMVYRAPLATGISGHNSCFTNIAHKLDTLFIVFLSHLTFFFWLSMLCWTFITRWFHTIW